MAVEVAVQRGCPTCGTSVKPVPVHPGRLRHYRCPQCRDFYCEMYGELAVCELPDHHVAFYEDYRSGIRG